MGRPTVNPYTMRPPTSPYLNLLRDGGQNLGFNYHRLVRPELEFRQHNLEQFRDLQGVERRQEQTERGVQTLWSQLGPTGHSTSFQSYGGYFGGGVGGRATTIGRGAAPRPGR